jgi:hypothetical protein
MLTGGKPLAVRFGFPAKSGKALHRTSVVRFVLFDQDQLRRIIRDRDARTLCRRRGYEICVEGAQELYCDRRFRVMQS